MKNRDKKIKRLLAGPYIIWAAGFIVIPLLMIFYYGLSDKSGHVTFHNIAQITTPENLKALGLALLLSLVGLYHGFRGLGEEDTYKGFPYAGCVLNGLVLIAFAGIYMLGW